MRSRSGFLLARTERNRRRIRNLPTRLRLEDISGGRSPQARSGANADGFDARAHFHDACASIWLAFELVHLEELVLHDAEMDLRTPTHELTSAHAVLRARRRIAATTPGRFLSGGLDDLRGKGETAAQEQPAAFADADVNPVGEEFAAIDAAIERSSRLLQEAPAAAPPSIQAATDLARSLIHDEDFAEAGRLADWRREVEATRALPPTLAAALAHEAWRAVEPLEHQNWFGPLLVADLLRQRGQGALPPALPQRRSAHHPARTPAKPGSRDADRRGAGRRPRGGFEPGPKNSMGRRSPRPAFGGVAKS